MLGFHGLEHVIEVTPASCGLLGVIALGSTEVLEGGDILDLFRLLELRNRHFGQVDGQELFNHVPVFDILLGLSDFLEQVGLSLDLG